MAEQYGMRGKEVLKSTVTGNSGNNWRNSELQRNIVDDYEYYSLAFYTGDFEMVKKIKKSKGFTGMEHFIYQCWNQAFLIYLYEKPLPSKAAARIAAEVGFPDTEDGNARLDFERAIQEECSARKMSEFWNYFQKWKGYFPMEEAEREKYLIWAEKSFLKEQMRSCPANTEINTGRLPRCWQS